MSTSDLQNETAQLKARAEAAEAKVRCEQARSELRDDREIENHKKWLSDCAKLSNALGELSDVKAERDRLQKLYDAEEAAHALTILERDSREEDIQSLAEKIGVDPDVSSARGLGDVVSDAEDKFAELEAERDRLAEEVRRLRDLTKKNAELAQCILLNVDDEKWSVPKDPIWVPTIRAHAYCINEGCKGLVSIDDMHTAIMAKAALSPETEGGK